MSVDSFMRMLADLFCCTISSYKEYKEAGVVDFSTLSLYFLTHAAIQVQFVRSTSTVNEGNSMTPLTIQLLLTPADATLLFNIIITLSVSSGSATGTVHG